jgi:GT2 family glycosyltransferase/lipopolysaccharide/colanic/teichoic acid biosynthesis glycosyltransferase
LQPCLEALRAQEYPGDTEVIVVDNASSDGTPEMVRERFPWVDLVAGDENLGYSKGVNVGIRRASGKYFLILNPDTIVRKDSIQKLADFMERTPDAGIVGPKLVFHDGNVQLSCRRFYTFKVLLLRRTPLGKLFKNSQAVRDHLMLDYDHESAREVDWLLGAAMLVRREAVESVGLMDERFFLYFEDVDWCYRMKQDGLKVYYQPESVIVHGYTRESAQSVLNRSFFAHLVSLFRYYEKWNTLLYFMKKYREVSKVLLFILIDLVAFNAAFLSAYYLRVFLDEVFINPIFPITVYKKFVLFENLLFFFSFVALGLYKIRRETRSVDELFDVAKAIIFASILLMTSTYLGQIRTYSRMVVAFVVPFAIIYDWGLRGMIRKAHRKLLSLKVDLKRACIVGPREKAKALELRLIRDDRLGVDVVGIVDTDATGQGDTTGTLGPVEDIEKIVDKYRVQEVILLPGAVSEERFADFVTMGRRRVLDITLLTDYVGLVFHQATVSDLSGSPVITYPRDTRYAIDRIAKRVLDVVMGGIFVLVSAVFYVIYLLYALFKGFKPFTSFRRLGLEGEPFAVPTAGDGRSDGPSDFVNLPLFWLVVVGKMSIVGPYPLTEAEASKLIPGAGFRTELRPGITGFWRMGTRKEITVEELLAQDANYVRNWSLVQDFKIFLTTLGNIVTGKKQVLSLVRNESDQIHERNT